MLDAFKRSIATLLKKFIIDPLRQEIVTLKTENSALKAEMGELRAELKALRADLDNRGDQGVWQAGQAYRKENGVTYDGHYWIAKRDTMATPGGSPDDWRLAVRRGKQGRDGRPGRDADGLQMAS